MNTFSTSMSSHLLLLVTAMMHVSSILCISRIESLTPDRKHSEPGSPSLMSALLRRTAAGRSVCRCGHSSDSIASHFSRQTHAAVIGGHESDPGSFPWIAALLDPFGFNFCAGALIRKNFILTAAHCVFNKKPRDVSVVVGHTDLDVAYLYNRVHVVRDIFVHPGFIHSNWSHDIALIQLSDMIHGQEPICLPDRSQRDFDHLLVAGWGRTSPSANSIKPSRLRQVSLPQVNQVLCEKTWAENFVSGDQLCAGSAGRDTCIYDSGSPLMSRHWSDSSGSRFLLAGVTSFGSKRCGDPEKPGVYTRVGSYLSWIEFHAGRDWQC